MLKDQQNDYNHQYADCPTKEHILLALQNAIVATQPGDTLYVHYSGHGSHLVDQLKNQVGGGDEKDGQDECICPVDFNWNKLDDGFIRDDTLNDILVKKLVTGAKLRVVFDSCHSGSALDLPHRWISGILWENENYNDLDKDIVFISGCKDQQTSADSNFNNRNNGALTWSFLTSLKESANSPVSWKDLEEKIRDRLCKAGYEQIPQMSFENKKQMDLLMDLI